MAEFVSAGRTVPAGNGWNWIVQGWEIFKRQPGIWIALLVIYMVIVVVLAFIPVLGSLANIALAPVFTAGMLLGCRALEEGGELKVEHLFEGFRQRFGVLVKVGLLYLAANVVIALAAGLTMGASVFRLMNGNADLGEMIGAAMGLLLAGLIALALMLPVLMAIWFAPPLVVFNQLGAIDALKTSFAACLKNIVPFLVYGVILLGMAIVASIPFGLGWLVLGPVLVASLYTAYRDIFFS
jgi:uncharacterized membrane protein